MNRARGGDRDITSFDSPQEAAPTDSRPSAASAAAYADCPSTHAFPDQARLATFRDPREMFAALRAPLR